MNKKSNVFIGAILVLIGVLFLLGHFNILKIEFNISDIGFLISRFFPVLFFILPGLAFHYGFFNGGRRDPGLLVPGGILLTIGATLEISLLFNLWSIMWPGYVLATAVGLFELYYFGNRERGLLIPVFILGGLSLLFFSGTSFNILFDFSIRELFVPIALIVIGLLIMFRNGIGSRH